MKEIINIVLFRRLQDRSQRPLNYRIVQSIDWYSISFFENFWAFEVHLKKKRRGKRPSGSEPLSLLDRNRIPVEEMLNGKYPPPLYRQCLRGCVTNNKPKRGSEVQKNELCSMVGHEMTFLKEFGGIFHNWFAGCHFFDECFHLLFPFMENNFLSHSLIVNPHLIRVLLASVVC